MAGSFGFPKNLRPGKVFRRPRKSHILGLVLCVTAAAASYNYYQRQHAQLWVVNGLPTAMTMKFDDTKDLYVSEQSYRTITLPEGRHRVEIDEPKLNVAPEEFEFHNQWWERFLFWRPPIHVLAPGRTAAMVVERERQEAPGEKISIISRDLSVGRLLVTYHDIDLAFLDFPARPAGDRSGPLEQTLLYVDREHPKLMVTPELAAAQPQPRDCLSFAEAQLVAAPGEGGLLDAYIILSLKMKEGDRCLRFLERKLAQRPIWHSWHRAYQYVFDRLGRLDEAVRRYDELVAQEAERPGPGYSGLLYLRGRLELDDDRLLDYMKRAVTAHPGNYFAWYQQGFVRLTQGNLKEAEEGLRNAFSLHSIRANYRDSFFECAIGLGHQRNVGRVLDREFERNQIADLEQQRLLLCALVLSNQLEAVPRAQARFARLANATQPGDPSKLELQSRLYLMYLQSEFDKMLTESTKLDDRRLHCQALLELGRLQDLPQDPSFLDLKPSQANGSQHLLLSIAWALKQDQKRSAEALQDAIREFSRGSPEERQLAISLGHPDKATVAEVRGITVPPSHKALALVVLVQRGATQKAELLELATKLNFSRQFPYHFVKRAVDALRTPSESKRT